MPRVTGAQRQLGAILLELICDWDAWVSRRVDSFHFAGDDERSLHRCQSVDLKIPGLFADAPDDLLEGLGGFPTPLTVVGKWRLPKFSLRDGSEASVPLLQREQSVPIAAAMLIALGTFVKTDGEALLPGDNPAHVMPDALCDELIAIVGAEAVDGLRRCVELSRKAQGGQAIGADVNGDDVSTWRRVLAGSPTFMSLAYELAQGCLLMAVVPGWRRQDRQVLKLSYDSYMVPPERDRWLVRIGHAARWLTARSRDLSDPARWPTGRRRRARSAEGKLVLSTVCEDAPERLAQGTRALACALATVSGAGGRRTFRLRPTGAIEIDGLPPGSYGLRVDMQSGFELAAGVPDHVTLRAGETARALLAVRHPRLSRRVTLATPRIAAPAARIRAFTRGCAWRSKSLAIRVRLGGGGSYHCEIEAPPGLHATRARLIANVEDDAAPATRAHDVDLVLQSAQHVHMYAPAHRLRPATGFACVNLRPRAETILRPALMTALAAIVTLMVVSYIWDPREGFGADPPWALIAILLGGPSGLAAYFAQAVPSRVTNAMLYGVRLIALLPALLSLAAAGVLLVGTDFRFSDEALRLFASVAGASLIMLWISYRFAEHPPEQSPSDLRQGPGFERRYAATDVDATGRVERASRPMAGGSIQAPEVVRDRMLARIGGMTRATRAVLLGERSLPAGQREVPPALCFDSGESPTVFVGLESGGNLERVRFHVRTLLMEAGTAERADDA